ncbi:helix-turn-helix domain-containing protein [Streptomyces sp. NPDC005962]|uniref:helix-turn-helix domain-containing protein n=1 Tax=Streptomyces sp. NPDC005962 TaxID=3154466 RepID=UPI0033C1AF1B
MPRWKPLPEGTDPSVRQLVAHLRRLKDRSGLSLAALETKTGCSRSSWERYLSGRALPSQRAIVALCELSGTDRARLLALREVAETVWDASTTANAHVDTNANVNTNTHEDANTREDVDGEDQSSPAAGGGRGAERRGVARGVFTLVVTAAFAGAAVTGVLLGRGPEQEARAATRLPAVRCDVRSEQGAIYAGHSRTWKETVGLGYYGERVAEAECLLGHHGYDTGRVDGLYDIATRDAARRAQRDAGVVPDGIIGQRTWPVLRREG